MVSQKKWCPCPCLFPSYLSRDCCFSLQPQPRREHFAAALGNNFSHTDQPFPMDNFHLNVRILGKLSNPFPTLLNCRDFAAEVAPNYNSGDFYENLLRLLMMKANDYCLYFFQISVGLYLLLCSLQHDVLYWSGMAQKYTFSCIEWIGKSCVFN